MSNLVHQRALTPDAAYSGSGRPPSRAVVHAVDNAHGRGLVRAANVRAAAFVTYTAMQYVASLSADEGRLISQCPLAERRLGALVDTFTDVAAAEIAGMRW